MTPTASVTVDIFPSGTPGMVIYEVTSTGVELTPREIVQVLRDAAEHIDTNPDDSIPI